MNTTLRIAAVSATAFLLSCGGSELIAVLGFIGPAGGDFNVDGNSAQPGLQPQLACGADPCVINVQVAATNNPATGTPWERLYDSAFDLEWTSNRTTPSACVLPANAKGSGRVDGRKITLGSCFVGESVSVIEMVSTDGATRLFFNFTPNFTDGVWVDIHDESRRFKFDSGSAACQLTTPTKTVGTYSSTATDLPSGTAPAVTLVIGGQTWSGGFFGVSSLRLTRTGATMELQRRRDTVATCP